MSTEQGYQRPAKGHVVDYVESREDENVCSKIVVTDEESGKRFVLSHALVIHMAGVLRKDYPKTSFLHCSDSVPLVDGVRSI